MPPIAAGVGGAIAGGIGAGLSQSAANKGPQPLIPGLNETAISGLKGLANPAFAQILSMISTGNPVDTSGMEAGLTATQNLQTAQNLAQIKEQFGSSGLSASSPAAVGTSNLLANTQANFMNTLASLRYQSASDATNRELSASEFGLSSLFGPAFTYKGPPGSVAGAVLGGASSGASSGLATGTSAVSMMQMLALLRALG